MLPASQQGPALFFVLFRVIFCGKKNLPQNHHHCHRHQTLIYISKPFFLLIEKYCPKDSMIQITQLIS